MRIGSGLAGAPISAQELSEVTGREHMRAEIERIRARGRIGERRKMQENVPAAFRRPGH